MKFVKKAFLAFMASLALLVASTVIHVRSVPPSRPEACDSEVDLRRPGQTLEDYPLGHQGFGETNLCGFFSAAAMIDAWRSSLPADGLLQRIDPVALAVELAKDRDLPIWLPLQNTTDGLNNRAGRWGSLVCPIVNYVREYGACTQRIYSEMDWKAQARFADKNIQIFDLLFDYGRQSALERKRTLREVALRIQQLYHELPPVPARKVELSWLEDLIFRNDIRPYRTISALMHRECETDRVRFDTLPACHSSYHIGLDLLGMRRLQTDPMRTDRALNQIHELLSRARPFPVGIAYCGQIMREGKAFHNRSLFSKKCSPHWAVVIGRKRIGGECHLLIRNSSHPDKPYHADWVRDGMDIWIEAKALQRTIYSVQWLDPEGALPAKGVARFLKPFRNKAGTSGRGHSPQSQSSSESPHLPSNEGRK